MDGERGLECAMEALDHTICLRMISCGTEMFNPKLSRKFIKQLGLELGSAIGDDGFRNSISRNPVRDEVFYHSFG